MMHAVKEEPALARRIGGPLHDATCPGPRASGGLRSEIKEETKSGDIRGEGYPVASAPRATITGPLQRDGRRR